MESTGGKKMKGKNKKLLWFEAGILIVTMTTFAIGSSISVAQLFGNPGSGGDNNLLIKMKDSYKVKINTLFDPELTITGGMPPYNVTIKWGDGSKPENFTTTEHQPPCSHRYTTIGTYTLQVWVTDSVGNHDYDTATVVVYEPHCFVTVGISIIWPSGQRYLCQGDIINLMVTVYNACNTEDYDATSYTVYANSTSPCIIPLYKTHGGPIAPCGIDPIPFRCCQSCPQGWHTIKATVITDIKNDNPTPSGILTFYIFSQQWCNILNRLPSNSNLLEQILSSHQPTISLS